MSAQYHNGHWYGGGQDIDIQSDPTATSFESGKVPTGDTVQSVLNSNLAQFGLTNFNAPTSLYHIVNKAKSNIPFIFSAYNIGDYSSLGIVLGMTTLQTGVSSAPRTVLFSFSTGKILLVQTNMSTQVTTTLATIG